VCIYISIYIYECIFTLLHILYCRLFLHDVSLCEVIENKQISIYVLCILVINLPCTIFRFKSVRYIDNLWLPHYVLIHNFIPFFYRATEIFLAILMQDAFDMESIFIFDILRKNDRKSVFYILF